MVLRLANRPQPYHGKGSEDRQWGRGKMLQSHWQASTKDEVVIYWLTPDTFILVAWRLAGVLYWQPTANSRTTLQFRLGAPQGSPSLVKAFQVSSRWLQPSANIKVNLLLFLRCRRFRQTLCSPFSSAKPYRYSVEMELMMLVIALETVDQRPLMKAGTMAILSCIG